MKYLIAAFSIIFINCSSSNFGRDICQSANGIDPSDSISVKVYRLLMNYNKINPSPSKSIQEKLDVIAIIERNILTNEKSMKSLMTDMGAKNWECPEYFLAFKNSVQLDSTSH